MNPYILLSLIDHSPSDEERLKLILTSPYTPGPNFYKHLEQNQTFRKGHFLFIKSQPNFQYTNYLADAFFLGNYTIINLIITLGGHDFSWDWDDALYGACRGLHLDLVNWAVKEGASYCAWCNNRGWKHTPHVTPASYPFDFDEETEWTPIWP